MLDPRIYQVKFEDAPSVYVYIGGKDAPTNTAFGIMSTDGDLKRLGNLNLSDMDIESMSDFDICSVLQDEFEAPIKAVWRLTFGMDTFKNAYFA